MAKNRRGRLTHGENGIAPHLRPVIWSALLGAAVAAALATPVYADPPLPNTIPDAGARPLPAGAVQLPGTAPTVPTGQVVVPSVVNGPLATQIYTLETELSNLGQQLLTLEEQNAEALTALAAADSELRVARDGLTRAREVADNAAGEALKDAAALPPGAFRSDLHELGALSRFQRGQRSGGDTTGPARELARAEAAEQAAYQAFLAADAQSRQASLAYTEAETKLKQREGELLTLKRRNADELLAIERQRDADEQRLGHEIGAGDVVDGAAAHPRALAAVRYAMAQRGDRYVWATEGPDTFDCSGLIWAAYRSPGADYRGLPRVSRYQYDATRNRTVPRNAMLPGDLVFFASGSHWSTIHHVGMYIGGGKMVHAPNSGDVVKVSNVWWSRLYAVTRVFGAVSAPPTTPTPQPPPTTKPPKPTVPKPTTPKPDPTTPKPDPTTPKPGPTTPSPDPTTPDPDPTTPKPGPTTPTSIPPPPQETTEPATTTPAAPVVTSRSSVPSAAGSGPPDAAEG